ncbi:MAG: hypothetical protein ACTSV2_18675 [Candidatus Thorarchaeota archaeon]
MKEESHDIIRVISPPHCARGSTRCQKCKEALEVRKICLLRVYGESLAARPVIEVNIEGNPVFLAFDVMRYFETKEEALEYAKENSVSDIVFD